MKLGGVLMKKKGIIIAVSTLIIIGLFLIIYPHIEIQTKDKLIAFRYNDYIDEFEDELSYGELYAYYAKRDISVRNYEFKKFWFFHVITMDYIEGNFCDTQFMLDESYIQDFIERAKIKENAANLDIAKLIEGKKAIIKNKRYTGNDYDKGIFYQLDGKYEELYVFYVDDLLVIQVGSPDELPKFIAYK